AGRYSGAHRRSTDNWSRPAEEVEALMVLLSTYLARETRRLADAGVRLEVIGRRDRLADGLVRAIERAEAATATGDKLHLRVALDYSGRDAIVLAAARCGLALTREKFARTLRGTTPDVDLMIRTGGEQRLSDFLLWECAYAELMFSDLMWPDFDGAALDAAVVTFLGRTRRFGGLVVAPAAA
ncbi:MAG: polyprenyl diphosphate synthase, partial [Beijerinckiaceae bacterium]|nr:polyprenyl diphosphate synthase [Beijerinckiaceae bacterium]